MNRERAKELLPIIEAYADGEDVQFRGNYSLDPTGEWVNMPEDERMSMQFPRDDYEYRIKPKPREWWMDPSDFEIFDQDLKPIPNAIKVREVL